jgi:hypothetical protein
VTAAAGYAFTHFYGDDASTGTQFIGNSEMSGQIGYDRVLSTRTQVALMGGYQGYDFNVTGTAFHTQIIQAMYGYRVSGRMDFLIGAGPEFIHLTYTPGTRVAVAGRALLHYQFSKFSTQLSFERFETSGAGFFAGARTDVARLSASRPLSRVWQMSADLGFSRSARLQPSLFGVDASNYTYGFAGVAFHRAFSHSLYGYFSYQFNELAFDSSYCLGATVCNRISNRNVGTIGFDWTPRPIRLD